MIKAAAIFYMVGVLGLPVAIVASIHTGDPVWFSGVWVLWIVATKLAVLGILSSLYD